MPLTEEEIAANLDGALVEELQKQRYGDKKERAKRPKDRVPPGVSYTEVSFFSEHSKCAFFALHLTLFSTKICTVKVPNLEH